MKKITIISFLLFSIFSFSQNIRFEGIIQDSDKDGIEMANIMEKDYIFL